MTEWLLSGHNTQETLGIARPIALTHARDGLNNQIRWFLGQLADGTELFDLTLEPVVAVQGQVYLNINYFARNMGAVMPFDPSSIGVPSDQVPPDLVEDVPQMPRIQRLTLPLRFYTTYRWATKFYRHRLPDLVKSLRDTYWRLQYRTGDTLSYIWSLFEPEFYRQLEEVDRAHIVAALTITGLDGALRQQAPELLRLFAGQATATSLIGQRIWELRQTVEQSGEEVQRLLKEGIVDLDAYEEIAEAEPFVSGVRAFLQMYGHRGFRHEADWLTERLADHPEHILLAVASQMEEGEPPEVRAEAARRIAQKALQKMNPLKRSVWHRILRWGQQLIAWREESKSTIALRQATYGLAAQHLAHHFYPQQPEDVMQFYTLREFLAFVRSRGKEQVDLETLDRRRAAFELHQTQPPPPELIWYDPATEYWKPLDETEASALVTPQMKGIPASAGSGPVEGTALVTSDPLDAGRRLLELDGPVILVTRLTDPAWSGLFPRLTGVVTELGGVISHAAIVARENGLPAVVGVPGITATVRNGQRLRIDGATGAIEVLE